MDFHAVEENLRAMFSVLATQRESGEVRNYPGLAVVSLGSQFQMFNAVFLNSPVLDEADLLARIARATVHMNARGIPWAFWLCEDWMPLALRKKAIRCIEKQGLYFATEMPGMAAEFLRLGIRKDLPALEIRPVLQPAALQEFCRIGAICFHVPLPWFEEVFDSRTPQRSGFAAWLGYCEGQAVATAATVIANGAIGVYNVATLPAFRKRGIGAAMTGQAVRAAKEQCGLDRTVLQATRQGIKLYERMGYGSVTRILVFTSR